MISETFRPQAATFWLPGQRRRLRGQYVHLPDGGVEITVVGSLGVLERPLSSEPVADVVFANVAGIPVTCLSVHPIEIDGRGSHQWSRYTVRETLENAHLRDPSGTLFQSASAHYSHLQVFRRVRALPAQSHRADVALHGHRRQHDLVVELPEIGTVGFGIDVQDSVEAIPERHIYEARHFVHVRPKTPTTRQRIWEELFMPLASLLDLSGFGGGHTRDIVYWPREGSRRGSQPNLASLSGIRSRVHSSRPEPDARLYSSLLVHADNWDIAQRLREWYALWQRCPVAFSAFSSSISTNEVAPRLLHAASACDALHVALYPEAQERDAGQQKRLDDVLGSIGSRSHRSWARQRLKTAHYPNLARRLEGLADELDPELRHDLLGVDVKAWAEHVVDARNAIAHSDRRAFAYHSNPRLLWEMGTTLASVFALVIMGRIGFTSESAAQAFRDSWTTRQHVGRYPGLSGHSQP